MDFVSGFTNCQAFNAMLVIVDLHSKMRHLIPVDTFVNVKQTATVYLQPVWKLNSLPVYITSDRGTRFTFHF